MPDTVIRPSRSRRRATHVHGTRTRITPNRPTARDSMTATRTASDFSCSPRSDGTYGRTKRGGCRLNVVFARATFVRTAAAVLAMCVADPCRAAEPVAEPYRDDYPRPLAVFTERPVNVADYALVPVVRVSASDLRMVYRPQIDGVSKTEPIVMCKSSPTKSFEATPAVQVPLRQPFYMHGERTLIPFPKTVTILHGGYRVSIPVGVVVAPVPAAAFRAGPVFVTTLYAIPAAPLPPPPPVPVGFVPWSSYPPNPSQYLPPPPPYSPPPPPPQYSQSAPAAPTYYQHGGDYSGEDANDLGNRDPPGKLYSQFAAAVPFQNSKESPLLHQLRQESEYNRNRYGPPSYSNQYQTVDA